MTVSVWAEGRRNCAVCKVQKNEYEWKQEWVGWRGRSGRIIGKLRRKGRCVDLTDWGQQGAHLWTSTSSYYGSGSWVLSWRHPFFLEEKMQFSPRAVFCQLNESGLLEPDCFLLMCLYFLFPRRCFPKPQAVPSQSQLLLVIGWSSASSWKILLGRGWEGSLLGWSFGPEPEDQGAVWSSTSALLPFCPEEVYPVIF